MAENELGNTDNFSKKITAASGTGIIEVLNCEPFFQQYADLTSSYHLGKHFYLESFSGAAYLPSLAEAPFPDLYPEMSTAQKLAAMARIEENFPYIGIKFYCKKGANGDWDELSTTKVQNKQGKEVTYPWTAPYLTINELKVLGGADRIGIQVINYGDGVLGVGDYINIKGDFRFNLDLVEKPRKTIGAGLPYGLDIPTIPTLFRPANSNRAILYATNRGNTPIWIAGTPNFQIGSGIYLAPDGALTEQILTGELWAIAEGGTSRISGIEASYV